MLASLLFNKAPSDAFCCTALGYRCRQQCSPSAERGSDKAHLGTSHKVVGAGQEKASRLVGPLKAGAAALLRAVAIPPSRLPGAASLLPLLGYVR